MRSCLYVKIVSLVMKGGVYWPPKTCNTGRFPNQQKKHTPDDTSHPSRTCDLTH